MGLQRHVINRQTLEITLGKQENAWQVQQTLSRILQQQLPAVLDLCLTEASSPDCLQRIDRLELDLGELDSSRLEAELLEKIESALRQALGKQLGGTALAASVQQQDQTMQAHVELLEHFVREGHLPWWADSSQRGVPENSLSALLKNAPHALKQALPGLIKDSRCLQRLIIYFDDNHLTAIVALLNAVANDLAASLLQTLLAVQAPLQQRTRMSTPQLRATLWQSVLQVSVAGDAAITRHGEFLHAVTLRWAKLQGLPHQVLLGCIRQQPSTSDAVDNQWLQAIGLAHSSSSRAGEGDDERQNLRIGRLRATAEPSPEGRFSKRYAMPSKHHPSQANAHKAVFDASANQSDVASADSFSVAHVGIPVNLKRTSGHGFVPISTDKNKPGNSANKTSAERPTAYWQEFARAVISHRYSILRKTHQIKPANESIDSAGAPANAQVMPYMILSKQPNGHDAAPDAPVNESAALIADDAFLATTVSPDDIDAKPANQSSADRKIAEPAGKAAISSRHAILKRPHAADVRPGIETGGGSAAGANAQGQDAANVTTASPVSRGRAQQKGFAEDQANTGVANPKPDFSDADTVYITNAGLCMLWPFLPAFFERLGLVQDGRFHNRAAKHCAVTLLHYLASADLDPPEYILPFNKLLSGMAHNEIFEFATPLTDEQTEACDTLLAAVIDNAPILNNMSLNGFRGSFLLRRGSLSASGGSWLLRVERETYDVVLERFPWSWQWFKLPWMDYPLRVEW